MLLITICINKTYRSHGHWPLIRQMSIATVYSRTSKIHLRQKYLKCLSTM